MVHPYVGHRENAVGKRRVKVLMKSGGYARGGAASHGPDCKCASCRSTGGRTNGGDGYADGGIVQGEVALARLDKRAAGGGIRKLTPSKRKPHLNVNIVNVSRGAGRRRGLLPPPPAIPAIGGAPALPAPPIGLKPPGMAKGGRMRKGKDYGQGSGEGRLEEYRHMKGK